MNDAISGSRFCKSHTCSMLGCVVGKSSTKAACDQHAGGAGVNSCVGKDEDVIHVLDSMAAQSVRALEDVMEGLPLGSEARIKIGFVMESIVNNTMYDSQLEFKVEDPEDQEMSDYITETMALQPVRHSSMMERHDRIERHNRQKKLRFHLKTRVSMIGAMIQLVGNREQMLKDDMMGAHLSEECKAYLREHMGSWNIDIFKVYKLSNKEPLVAVMWYTLKHYNLINVLKLNVTKVLAFVREIERGYPDNPYHCSTHGADVVQGVFWFIETALLKNTLRLSPLEIYSMLIAAAVHDYLHPGMNNKFLQVTQHEWAIRYNNVSILEMHACSEGCKLMTKPEYNCFEGCTKDQQAESRAIVIDCVLATDLKHHPEIIMEFKKALNELNELQELKAHVDIPPELVSPELKAAAIKLIVKCADISNPARPWNLYARWIPRIFREFHGQGDEERRLGMPISPFMDREHQSTNKTQIGFIKYVVKPLYDLILKIAPDSDAAHACLVANLETFEGRVRVGDDSVLPSDLDDIV